MAEKITPRANDYSQWYLDIVKQAGLAENSDVRGCMVIKPHGYAIWEKMQRALDRMFKDTGHVNAYFPLFIPKSLPRQGRGDGRGLRQGVRRRHALPPQGGPRQGPRASIPTRSSKKTLIIRPTSETIIWNTYKNWIQSYRDLPLLINQWCNVVRWEMRTRLFLRTAEFLWQEGHTAHATQQEAEEETRQMVEVYRTFAEEWMAMPVLAGPKSEGQKFPGAVYTLCIEAMMQDGKALQAGTSHFLGQNFAKAFDVQVPERRRASWSTPGRRAGASRTRLIGGLHHDALRRPGPGPAAAAGADPRRHRAARQERRRAKPASLAAANKLAAELRDLPRDEFYGYEPMTVKVDDRRADQPGFKFNEWELRGVPVRVELGPKDLEKEACVAGPPRPAGQGRQGDGRAAGRGRRPHRRRCSATMQTDLFDRRKTFRDANICEVNSLRRVQEEDRGAGRLPLGALGRHARDGGPHRRRDEGDDPLHPVRPARRRRASAW